MNARWIRFLGLLAAMVTVCGVAQAERARPLTHAMALDSVAAQVAGDLLRQAALPAGRPVLLAASVPGDTLGVLTRQLVRRLTAADVSVRLTGAGSNPSIGESLRGTSWTEGVVEDAGPGPLHLAIQIDGATVSYVRAARRFPFGVSGYDRLVTIRANGTLLDHRTGEVLWSRTASGRYEDRVSKRDLTFAASGSGGIRPPTPPGPGFRILEPLIVVGVVTGLIVLFYSNRT